MIDAGNYYLLISGDAFPHAEYSVNFAPQPEIRTQHLHNATGRHSGRPRQAWGRVLNGLTSPADAPCATPQVIAD